MSSCFRFDSTGKFMLYAIRHRKIENLCDLERVTVKVGLVLSAVKYQLCGKYAIYANRRSNYKN